MVTVWWRGGGLSTDLQVTLETDLFEKHVFYALLLVVTHHSASSQSAVRQPSVLIIRVIIAKSYALKRANSAMDKRLLVYRHIGVGF